MARRYGVPVFTHIRYLEPYGPKNTLMGHQELIGVGRDDRGHTAYLPSQQHGIKAHPGNARRGRSRCGPRPQDYLSKAILMARAAHQIGAPFLAPANLANIGITPADITYLKTGKPVASDEELATLRRDDPNGTVLVRFLNEDDPKDRALFAKVFLHGTRSPRTPSTGNWTASCSPMTFGRCPPKRSRIPRSAGCFSRILGRFVREENKLTLLEAIRRCSLRPAQILEAGVPQMKNKGRFKVGADADIIVFDAKTVRDQATYQQPNQTSVGMRYVLVNGTFVRDAELVKEASPGRAIRNRTTS